MIPVCDFCARRADAPDDALFVAAPGGRTHICDGCVDLATSVLSRKRLTDRKERATTDR